MTGVGPGDGVGNGAGLKLGSGGGGVGSGGLSEGVSGGDEGCLLGDGVPTGGAGWQAATLKRSGKNR